jgi:hypothetical protein
MPEVVYLLMLLSVPNNGMDRCGRVINWNSLETPLTALVIKLVLTTLEDSGEPLLILYPLR